MSALSFYFASRFIKSNRDLIKEEIERIQVQIEQAKRDYDLNKAAELEYGTLINLQKQLAQKENLLADEGEKVEKSLLREEVMEEDIARVISCALRHRLRKDPLEQIDSGDRVIKAFCKIFERGEPNDLNEFELAAID